MQKLKRDLTRCSMQDIQHYYKGNITKIDKEIIQAVSVKEKTAVAVQALQHIIGKKYK